MTDDSNGRANSTAQDAPAFRVVRMQARSAEIRDVRAEIPD